MSLRVIVWSILAMPALAPSGPAAGEPPRTDAYGDPLPAGALMRIGTTRLRHGEEIASLVFSPQGNVLASAGGDGAVRLWDPCTGKLLRQMVYAEVPACLAFAPDGRSLVVAEAAETIHIQAVGSGREVRRLTSRGRYFEALAYSPDGKWLACASTDGVFTVWDVAAGKEICRIRHAAGSEDTRWRIALTRDGRLLACGGRKFVKVTEPGCWLPQTFAWDVATGRRLARAKGPEEPISFAAYSPDGKTLFCGSGDMLASWRVTPPGLSHSVSLEGGGFTCFTLSPDGKRIASGCWDGSVQVRDTATLRQLSYISDAGYHVAALAFSPDGNVLATAQNGVIRLWDIATGKRLDPFEGHEEAVTCIAFARHGQRLVVPLAGGALGVWDVATGGRLRRLRDEGTVERLIALSPNEKLLASANEDNVSVWELATGRLVHRWSEPQGWAESLGFTDDSRLALAGYSATEGDAGASWLALWDTRVGQELHRRILVPKGERQLVARAISPDGRFLVTSDRGLGLGLGGPFPPVYLWDVARGRRLGQMGGMDVGAKVIAFSPNGRMLVTGSYASPLQLWEVLTGKERQRFTGDEWRGVECATFSPDGRLLTVGAGPLRVVDLASGKPLRPVAGHEGAIRCLTFSPDGRRLTSGSADTTALVWDVGAITRGMPAAVPGTGKDPAALWERLGDVDAGKAYRALWGLAAAPDQAVPLLRERLRPVPPAGTQVRHWIADLGSADFAARERATHELQALGELARPAMEELLQGRPAPEVRQRAQRLLEQPAPPPSAEQVRSLRAVEALEYMGTAQARRLLQELAGGARGARLTQEAKASLDRLARRAPAR
jgi:WD40 repeat protein